MSLSAARGRPARAAALVVLSLIVAFAAGSPALLAQQAAPVSPARGHASVVAQGVAALPGPEAIWRITYHELDDQRPTVDLADAGFLVVDRGSLLAEEGKGRRALLLPGEASFRPRSARLVDPAAAAAAFAVEVVTNGTPAPERGRAFYAGPAFQPPTGERDLDLVRDVLEPDEATTVIGQAAPVLVLATAGTVDVEATDGTSARLKPGEAGAFSGDVIVTGAGSAPSTIVAAVIGREASTAAGPRVEKPAAKDGPGSIEVALRACPAGVRPREANPERCPLAEDAVSLQLVALDGDGAKAVDGAEAGARGPRWASLPLGEYALRATGFAPGLDRFFIPGLDGVGGPPDRGYPAANDQGFKATLTETSPAFRLDAYALAAADGDRADAEAAAQPVSTTVVATPRRGAITLRVWLCPDALGTFDASRCALAPEPYAVTLASANRPTPLSLADARPDGSGGWVWEGVAFDDYVLQQPVIAPGAATYYLPVGQLLPDNSGYVVTLAKESPQLALDLYDLAPAPLPTPLPTVAPTLVPTVVPTAAAVAPAAAAAAPTEAAPAPADTDGDGLPDDVEATYGTDPGHWDSDRDGVGDAAEVAAGTDPLAAPPAAAATAPPTAAALEGAGAGGVDTDFDGLSDAAEAAAGTSPSDSDSDNDGWIDGNEVNLGTDPLDPNSFPRT